MIDLDHPLLFSRQDYLREIFGSKKYTGTEVNCLHPRIIVNPAFPELISKYGVLYLDGYIKRYPRKGYLFHYPFRPSLRGIDYDNYKDYYVIDESSGETFPIYLAVPCNHCDVCEKSKLDMVAHRCVLETMCYTSLPWFVTLTYRNECLPDEGVNVRDYQLFLKDFRINLERLGYHENIRYFVTSEYSPVGRPHYHFIFWNLHPKKDFRYHKILYLMQKSWSKGFIYNEIVSPKYRKDGKPLGSPQKCFEYVAKYINKDCDVPPGKNPTFSNSSNRGGGIGAPFLDKYVIPKVRKSLNPDFLYLNIFGRIGRTERLFFNRYVLNRCFPSFCTSVPLSLRNSWRNLCLCHSIMPDYRHDDFEVLFTTLSAHLHSVVLSHHDVMVGQPSCLSSCSFIRYQIDNDIDNILKILPAVNFDLCQELDRKRRVFVSKLLMFRKPRDLSYVAYRYRRSKQKTREMVVLPM